MQTDGDDFLSAGTDESALVCPLPGLFMLQGSVFVFVVYIEECTNVTSHDILPSFHLLF